MPLKQTEYGGICPLGKFRLDPAAPGSYTADPVEKCINCNFSDMSIKRFDLEKICKCPSDMDWNEYDKLRKQYCSGGGELTKTGFWKFVNQNRRK
jgi:hypothetical protein